jgi:hypothetical protein
MKKLIMTVAMVMALAMPVYAEESITREVKEVAKEKRLQLKEAAKQSREERKLKLGQIKDARKRDLASRLSNRMCDLNKRRTAKMGQHLEKMAKILDKVVVKAAEAKGNGKDTTVVDTTVTAARKAIEEAKAAVSAQAGKACEVTVSGTDGALRSDVETARAALESGLKEVHAKVVAARKAVGEAIRALAAILGEPVPEPVTQ